MLHTILLLLCTISREKKENIIIPFLVAFVSKLISRKVISLLIEVAPFFLDRGTKIEIKYSRNWKVYYYFLCFVFNERERRGVLEGKMMFVGQQKMQLIHPQNDLRFSSKKKKKINIFKWKRVAQCPRFPPCLKV